jgi:hypothetical protein
MKYILRKPFIYVFLSVLILYSILLFTLSDFGDTLFLAFQYVETVSWSKLIFSIILSLLIGIFISINACYLYREYKLKKDCKKGSVLTGAGVLAGLSVGICPLCVGGLLPLVLGIFGISFSFGILPFQGIEVQLIVLGLMILTTYMFYNRKI